MELLLRIQRRLMWRPLREVIVDDFRRWKAFEVQALSWHIARQVERASQARAVGVMLPTSGLFPAAMMAIWQLGRVAVPLNYLLSRPDM